jgi:hypothetical protein
VYSYHLQISFHKPQAVCQTYHMCSRLKFALFDYTWKKRFKKPVRAALN